MYQELYQDFLAGDDTLRIYRDEELIFASKKDQLAPLLDYLTRDSGAGKKPVCIFDKVLGNGAALLAVKANCREVYSPLGSELAVKTLERFGIAHHIDATIPYIMRDDKKGMCPLERLSTGKLPEDFFEIMQRRVKAGK